MSDEKRTEGEPHDELTLLTDLMWKAVEADPGYDERIKGIVFLNLGDRAGVGLFGYDSDAEAIADIFVHMRGIFAANGQELQIHPLRGGEMS